MRTEQNSNSLDKTSFITKQISKIIRNKIYFILLSSGFFLANPSLAEGNKNDKCDKNAFLSTFVLGNSEGEKSLLDIYNEEIEKHNEENCDEVDMRTIKELNKKIEKLLAIKHCSWELLDEIDFNEIKTTDDLTCIKVEVTNPSNSDDKVVEKGVSVDRTDTEVGDAEKTDTGVSDAEKTDTGVSDAEKTDTGVSDAEKAEADKILPSLVPIVVTTKEKQTTDDKKEENEDVEINNRLDLAPLSSLGLGSVSVVSLAGGLAMGSMSYYNEDLAEKSETQIDAFNYNQNAEKLAMGANTAYIIAAIATGGSVLLYVLLNKNPTKEEKDKLSK